MNPDTASKLMNIAAIVEPFNTSAQDIAREINGGRSATGRTLAPERKGDGMPTSEDERKLRRMYAVRVGMPNLYMDDGEASGSEHGIQIDFMREPVADIAAKVLALEVARYECGKTPNAKLTCPPRGQQE